MAPPMIAMNWCATTSSRSGPERSASAIQKLRLKGSKPSTSPNVWVTPNRPATTASEKLNRPAVATRRLSIANRGGAGGLVVRVGDHGGAAAAGADMIAQRLGAGQRDGVEHAIFILGPGRRAGFEPDPGKAEQAMERALLEIDVGDPVERDRAAGARQEAAVDADFIGADAIFELEPGHQAATTVENSTIASGDAARRATSCPATPSTAIPAIRPQAPLIALPSPVTR